MQIQSTTMTQKGQVTIPVLVRNALGLKRGDQVQFTLKKKVVQIKPAKKFSIMSLYGSLKSKVKPNLSGQDLIKWEKEMVHLAWAKEANK